MPLALLFVDDLRCHALERGTAFVDGFEEPPQELGIHRLTRLVPLAGSSAGSYRGSTAPLGGRAATAGFGVKPRENEEGRGGEAVPRSGAESPAGLSASGTSRSLGPRIRGVNPSLNARRAIGRLQRARSAKEHRD